MILRWWINWNRTSQSYAGKWNYIFCTVVVSIFESGGMNIAMRITVVIDFVSLSRCCEINASAETRNASSQRLRRYFSIVENYFQSSNLLTTSLAVTSPQRERERERERETQVHVFSSPLDRRYYRIICHCNPICACIVIDIALSVI